VDSALLVQDCVLKALGPRGQAIVILSEASLRGIEKRKAFL
jgi:hypothetical protein